MDKTDFSHCLAVLNRGHKWGYKSLLEQKGLLKAVVGYVVIPIVSYHLASWLKGSRRVGVLIGAIAIVVSLGAKYLPILISNNSSESNKPFRRRLQRVKDEGSQIKRTRSASLIVSQPSPKISTLSRSYSSSSTDLPIVQRGETEAQHAENPERPAPPNVQPSDAQHSDPKVLTIIRLSVAENLSTILSDWYFLVLTTSVEQRLDVLKSAIKDIVDCQRLLSGDAAFAQAVEHLNAFHGKLVELQRQLELQKSTIKPLMHQTAALADMSDSQQGRAIEQIEPQVAVLQLLVDGAQNDQPELAERWQTLSNELQAIRSYLSSWKQEQSAVLSSSQIRVDQLRYQQDQLLRSELTKLGYETVPVDGSGNCLFLSLADNNIEKAREYRKNVAKHMREHIDDDNGVLRIAIQGQMFEAISSGIDKGFSPELKKIFRELRGKDQKTIKQFVESTEETAGWKYYLNQLESIQTMYGCGVEIGMLPNVIEQAIYIYTAPSDNSSIRTIETPRGKRVVPTEYKPRNEYPGPFSDAPAKHIFFFQYDKHYEILRLPK